MAHEGNYKEYRSILHNCTSATIPHLGIFLTDLTFIEDGNPNLINGLINFDKRSKVGSVISDIRQYQCIGFPFKGNIEILSWIRSIEALKGEDEIYSISLMIEPRNTSEAVERLLMEDEKTRCEIQNLQLKCDDLEVNILFGFFFLFLFFFYFFLFFIYLFIFIYFYLFLFIFIYLFLLI